jgi:hypothetical protein
MSEELANQKRDLQRALDMPTLRNEQDSKASMQFLNGLMDGLTEDDLYGAEEARRRRGPGWRSHGWRSYGWKGRSMNTLLDVRKWLHAGPDDQHHIERAPGFRLVEVLKFFCRHKTCELVIEPMHADFLSEYYALLRTGQRRKAALLQCQMHACLVYAVVSERVLQAVGAMFTGRFKARPDK